MYYLSLIGAPKAGLLVYNERRKLERTTSQIIISKERK